MSLKNYRTKKIKAYELENLVILKPFTKEIEKEYLQASFYTVASLYEGFLMVLVEVSPYGVPLVSFVYSLKILSTFNSVLKVFFYFFLRAGLTSPKHTTQTKNFIINLCVLHRKYLSFLAL